MSNQRERLSNVMKTPTVTPQVAVPKPESPTPLERRVQLNVSIPENLRKRARVAALDQNTTIEKIVTDLLTDWLHKQGS